MVHGPGIPEFRNTVLTGSEGGVDYRYRHQNARPWSGFLRIEIFEPVRRTCLRDAIARLSLSPSGLRARMSYGIRLT